MASRVELKSKRADRASAAIPKTRWRKDGAAIALDDLDRKLLNLMQGSFPLEPRPFAAVASAAEVSELQVLTRVQRLLDKRIIRQVTPIYDTRALGYSSMLVAAKVDPENPWQAAKVVNSHPGVSHNYLRNHDFNMWFTLAVEPDSRLGLDGTLDVLKKLTGAESIRQLPTLKLFKIRMDLEMEGDTKALTSEGIVVEPVDLEPVPYDELDKDVIRGTAGGHAGYPRALRPGRRAAGHGYRGTARAPAGYAGAWHLAPSRRDPLSPPSRVLRQRDGRLEGLS